MGVDVLQSCCRRPAATLHYGGIGEVEVREIGGVEMAERVEAVGRDSQVSLLLPEPIGYLRRKQMGDISLRLYPLNDKVREKHGADAGSGFRVLSDPLPRLIANDCPTDMHKVPVYV